MKRLRDTSSDAQRALMADWVRTQPSGSGTGASAASPAVATRPGQARRQLIDLTTEAWQPAVSHAGCTPEPQLVDLITELPQTPDTPAQAPVQQAVAVFIQEQPVSEDGISSDWGTSED